MCVWLWGTRHQSLIHYNLNWNHKPSLTRHLFYWSTCSGADPGFQVRWGSLEKIAPSGGRRENFWGISCEKSRFYAKKSYFFQFYGDPPLMLQAGDSVNCLPIPPSFLLDLVFNLNMHDIFAAGCQATIDQQILLSSDDDHSLINVYVVVNFCDCVEANLSRLFV